MIRYWKLAPDGATAVPCEDPLEWGRWFETADRVVFQTMVGDLKVSTVFLGLDHQYGDGPPLLWETMVFGLPGDDEEMSRYPTFDAALAGHIMTVTKMRERYDGESQ